MPMVVLAPCCGVTSTVGGQRRDKNGKIRLDGGSTHKSCGGRPAEYVLAMIKVSVTYPSGEGTTFDHDYYSATHVPLAASAWSPLKTEIDKGIDGPNVAAVHFYFETVEAFHAGLGSPKTADVMADVVNYTNITPVMQVSEIVG